MSCEDYSPGALTAFLGGHEEKFLKKRKKTAAKRKKVSADDGESTAVAKAALEKTPESNVEKPSVRPKKRKSEDKDVNVSVSDDADKKRRRTINKEDVQEGKKMSLEEKQRTVFVGNAPLATKRKEIKQLFSKFGSIESVRMRSIVSPNGKLSKKIAAIKQEYAANMHSVNFYVKFKLPSSVFNALVMNGEKLGDHILRVDSCVGRRDYSQKTTVFVGNLPYNVNEEELSAYFARMGEVAFVRIVRDKKSGIGKGFGFVSFGSEASVPLALKLNGSLFNEREIRVKAIEKKKKRMPRAVSAKKMESSRKNDKNMKKLGRRISRKILWSKQSEVISDGSNDNKKRVSKKVKKLIKKRNTSKAKTIMK